MALYTVLLNANESGQTDHLLNEATIGLEQIYKKYLCDEVMNNIMALICGNYLKIHQHDSKRSLLFLLPNFSKVLKSLYDILLSYIDQIRDQTPDVQLETLNATIRMFAQDPDKYKELTQKLF